MAHEESLERALAPEPTKRKRSSILKQPDKKSRDSRTVSFNDKYFYKELYQDGTCDITNFFLGEDMDITMMDIVDPNERHNRTNDISVDMSMETIVNSQYVNTINMSVSSDEQMSCSMSSSSSEPVSCSLPHKLETSSVPKKPETSSAHSESGINSLPKRLETSAAPSESEVNSSPKKLETSLVASESEISSLANEPENLTSLPIEPQLTSQPNETEISSLPNQPDISSLASEQDISLNDTLYGAFHDSNEFTHRTSGGADTLVHNIEALDECIHKVDTESEECRRRLDTEIQDLFKFYRHIVNKDDPHEFAIAIFGLRHSLWLIIKIDPETYPYEKLKLRFAVRKQDRHLYPFREYAEAVKRYTKEGSYGYLKRFVINAQRFRRFLRKVGYRKSNSEINQHIVL